MQKQAATILSAELIGFQNLVESLSPNEINPLMSELHELIDNTIRLHQGKINLYTGDTFLAVFMPQDRYLAQKSPSKTLRTKTFRHQGSCRKTTVEKSVLLDRI